MKNSLENFKQEENIQIIKENKDLNQLNKKKKTTKEIHKLNLHVKVNKKSTFLLIDINQFHYHNENIKKQKARKRKLLKKRKG